MTKSMAVVEAPVVHSVGFSFAEMERLAASIAKSRLFGIQTPEQALTLMAISQAEGRHPALAARDYDIIQGRPAKKAEAMQRDFIAAGGKIEWHALDDSQADATFSHPSGGSVRISWDTARAQKAGLSGKDNWKKFPRAMLRSRCVSEGVRTVFPTATSGMYVPEEVRDFEPREPIDVTPAAVEPIEPLPQGVQDQLDPAGALARLEAEGMVEAAKGGDALDEWILSLSKADKAALAGPPGRRLRATAITADETPPESALEGAGEAETVSEATTPPQDASAPVAPPQPSAEADRSWWERGDLAITPPVKGNAPDWPAWSKAFLTRATTAGDGINLAILIGHNSDHIAHYKAAIGEKEAGHFDQIIAGLYARWP
jgi:hypothetical protein